MGSDRQLRGGIDLGGTKIEAIVVDDRNAVLGQARVATPTSGGPQAVAAAMAAVMRQAADAAGVEAGSLVGVGAGSPGSVDESSGVVSEARNLPGWEGSFALGEALSRTLGVPVRIGNDVAVATRAEHELGAGQGRDSLLGVFWGTGVGGGLILGGRPWRGRGGAGEIGHTVVKLGGRRCPCGRRGCLEAYAGRAAMEARARRRAARGAATTLFDIARHRGKDRLTSSIWWRAYRHGDPLATELIDAAVRALGAGIASAVNLLEVDAVVLGGGLGVRFGERFAARIADAMAPHLFRDSDPPLVEVSALGDLGGALGAALLARPQPGGAAMSAPADLAR
ncbi:MAG TPA: ROK family protein [Solirubrobacteraceae bacterium]|nr:ROK family protein [Solirubrobacteraceae bacterium]